MTDKWVVYTSSRWGGSLAETYWTGTFTESGKPAQSSQVFDAKHFNTARDAYDVAGFHRLLSWRVGLRNVESLH